MEQLATTPKHILTLLPPINQMSSLTSVTINIEGEPYIDFDVVKGALQRLSSCVKKIELTLYIFSSGGRSGLEAWLEQPGDGVMLRCVKSLHLRNGDWGYTEHVLGQLLDWFKIFPELQQLTLHTSRGQFSYGVEPNIFIQQFV